MVKMIHGTPLTERDRTIIRRGAWIGAGVGVLGSGKLGLRTLAEKAIAGGTGALVGHFGTKIAVGLHRKRAMGRRGMGR